MYYSKVHQKKTGKTIAHLSIWKCELGIVDIDRCRYSIKLSRTSMHSKIINFKQNKCPLERSHTVSIEIKAQFQPRLIPI